MGTKEETEMKFKPLNNRVIVTRVEKDQKTAGGIIIPDTAKEKPQEGKIVAVGPGKFDDKGKRRIPMDIIRDVRAERALRSYETQIGHAI